TLRLARLDQHARSLGEMAATEAAGRPAPLHLVLGLLAHRPVNRGLDLVLVALSRRHGLVLQDSADVLALDNALDKDMAVTEELAFKARDALAEFQFALVEHAPHIQLRAAI